MTLEKYQILIDELNEKTRLAKSSAGMKAMDYVNSGDEKDRISAKSYLHDANIWNQARMLVAKHYQ